jgi:tetratricopeptide (TPR) repeat protein
VAADLDRAARSRLRTLEKDNADAVARHLVMAGRLLEDDAELAYAHVQEAVRRAGRVDVVREAAGITAYRTGRYAEALRELRTARRLNGSDEHVPLMADCERGLGRPERALALADEHSAGLPLDARVELAIVVSGARLDMGQPEAAVAALNAAFVRSVVPPTAWRVAEARAEALRACGRVDEADALMSTIPEEAFGIELVEVVDLDDDTDVGGIADVVGEGRDIDAAAEGVAGAGATPVEDVDRGAVHRAEETTTTEGS